MSKLDSYAQTGGVIPPELSSIAAVITIIGGLVAVITFLVGMSAGAKIDRYSHSPGKQVRTNLKYFRELQKGLDNLIREIRRSEEYDFIVGIGAGGAIVGGILSRSLNVPYIALRRDSENPNEFLGLDSVLAGKRLLLVDDAARTGTTLKEASEFLLASGVEKIDCAVLLNNITARRAPKVAPGSLVTHYGLHTTDLDIALPWDYSRT